MATQTTHYNLTMPELSDNIGTDIPLLAGNFDTIDTQLYNANQKTGVPSGGSTGQVLTKQSDSIGWADPASGLPSGGTTGQVVTKTASGAAWQDPASGLPSGGNIGQVVTKTNTGAAWLNVPTELPSGGTNGQVLTKTSGGVSWQTPGGGGGGGDIPSGGNEGQVLTIISGEPAWGGVAVPDDGDADQILAVTDSYGTLGWVDASSIVVYPAGASQGDVLTYDSGSVVWQAPSGGLPSGGSEGDFLMLGSGGSVEWFSLIPSGGYAGQALVESEYGNLEWAYILPSGGSENQVLTRDAYGDNYWGYIFPTDGSEGYVLLTDGCGGYTKTDLASLLLGNFGTPVDGMVLMAYGSDDLLWQYPLPTVDNTDAGKVLMVNSTGEWVAANLP